ncbi:MAG: ChaN family lipoprotein [Magnetospirillum sp.]|nr:ChaN family lipoprotein [Magnetospirillum sp.]
MEREIKDSHCGMLPDAALPGMVRVQRGRDAVMAATLAQGLAGGKGAVLIAGAGHVRRDRGVPALLADRTPEARILSLAFLEVRPGETDPASYGALFDSAAVPFDAVWFTPRAEREDPCEDLRQHMEKKKEMGN